MYRRRDSRNCGKIIIRIFTYGNSMDEKFLKSKQRRDFLLANELSKAKRFPSADIGFLMARAPFHKNSRSGIIEGRLSALFSSFLRLSPFSLNCWTNYFSRARKFMFPFDKGRMLLHRVSSPRNIA